MVISTAIHLFNGEKYLAKFDIGDQTFVEWTTSVMASAMAPYSLLIERNFSTNSENVPSGVAINTNAISKIEIFPNMDMARDILEECFTDFYMEENIEDFR